MTLYLTVTVQFQMSCLRVSINFNMIVNDPESVPNEMVIADACQFMKAIMQREKDSIIE